MIKEFNEVSDYTYKTDFDFSYELDELPSLESFKYYKDYIDLKIILKAYETQIIKYRVCDTFLDYLKKKESTLESEKIYRVFFKIGLETRELEIAKLITGKIVLS